MNTYCLLYQGIVLSIYHHDYYYYYYCYYYYTCNRDNPTYGEHFTDHKRLTELYHKRSEN